MIGGAILLGSMTAAMMILQRTANRQRNIDSTVAAMPMTDAIVGGALMRVMKRFETASNNVPAPGSVCDPNSCTATFSELLSVDYVNFPATWSGILAGPHLLTKVPGSETVSYGAVASSYLCENKNCTCPTGSSCGEVDPSYCRATVTGDGKATPYTSYVFALQSVALSPSNPHYAPYHDFFSELYRPYVPAPGNEPPYSPPSKSLPSVPPFATTTYQFAIDYTHDKVHGEVVPQMFHGSDSWLTNTGAVKVLPPYLGFYWTPDGGTCKDQTHPSTVCNTTSTPFDFNFSAGDISASQLTAGNAPTFPANTPASAALARCNGSPGQTLDTTPNFGSQDSIYFCLRLRKADAGLTSTLASGIQNMFGEFVFRIRAAASNTPLSCATLSSKLHATPPQSDYYAELTYTLYWADTTNPNNPVPRMAAGTTTRMGNPSP